MPTFTACINPLMCPEIDSPAPGADPLNAAHILDYLAAPEADRSVSAFQRRYAEIRPPLEVLAVAPNEGRILEKLVWPLRQAIGSYGLANYLGCLAQCGMVGEMVAILLWDISKPQHRGHPMTAAEQEALFGSSFEKLGQDRRVRVLATLGLIDDSTKKAFDDLRIVRKRYLHFLSQPHDNIAADARSAFNAAANLTTVALGISFEDGAVVLRPELVEYLKERGVLGPS